MGGSALREGLGKEPGLPSNYELGAEATLTSMLLVVHKICQCNRRLLLQKSVFGPVLLKKNLCLLVQLLFRDVGHRRTK